MTQLVTQNTQHTALAGQEYLDFSANRGGRSTIAGFRRGRLGLVLLSYLSEISKDFFGLAQAVTQFVSQHVLCMFLGIRGDR